jgi:predicted component of type VI protein secretion system
MTLVLQGTKLNDEPLSQPLIGRFDERGGTIGRSDNATFTLPDPERLISRVQAQILFRDEGYWVEHISSASSTLHNGRPLSAGMRILLSEGDELRIGGYTLAAAFESNEASATVLRGRTVIMQPAGPPTKPRAAPAALEFGSPSPSASAEATHNFVSVGSIDPALWQEFLAGVGVDAPLPVLPSLSPEALREMGALVAASMRLALEGVLERYADHSDTVREQAQEDFRRLFAQAFRQAHEAQIRRGANGGDEVAAPGR